MLVAPRPGWTPLYEFAAAAGFGRGRAFMTTFNKSHVIVADRIDDEPCGLYTEEAGVRRWGWTEVGGEGEGDGGWGVRVGCGV